MYKIWVARNKLIFEHKATTAQDTISAIRSAREWQAAQQEETRAATSLATASGTPRSCPPDTVTGSSEIRRSLRVSHVRSPLLAEALALREAVTEAARLTISNV
ncbi:hypothetical protein YC2023_113185 [Brassica napus]